MTELGEDLLNAPGEGQDRRSARLAIAAKFLQTARTAYQADFESGKTGGVETAAIISAAHETLLKAIFACALAEFPGEDTNAPDSKPAAQGLSFCAVGGFGRGEMAPYSDLDVLFLTSGKDIDERGKNITEYVLYLLWDLGLKVGHAVRSPQQCIELSRKDETILTSLLDLRLLCGADEPAAKLANLLRKERTKAKTRAFVAAKLGSRDKRHVREGNSRYVIEPNIKEGKGGLRDLHELYWIARFTYGGKRAKRQAPVKPHGVSAYMQLGLLDEAALDRFRGAIEFLWLTRIHLHFLAGRAVEVLSFDRQDSMAKRMGYPGEYANERVEAFMHDYFQTTREVGALTRIACAKLEGQSALLLPQGLDRFLPTSRRGLKQPGFVLDHGRLDFANPKKLYQNPLLMLDLFKISGTRNLDIHPDAFAAILLNLNLIDDAFRENHKAAEIFIDILLTTKAPGAVLMSMNEAGVLGAYIPEFGDIAGRTQFNMHHAYTVDEHTISLVRYLHDIESGSLKREHPVSTRVVKSWDLRMRKIVYLACLLHDIGKGQGDQCIEGATLSRKACRRMGLPEGDVETVSWLVRNHLEMSETAQRRDISDPQTIERFAGIVGSVTRLQMLTVLTCVDMRAVGPGIWNDWKGELLRQLYVSTVQFLMGEMDTHRKVDALRDLMAELPEDMAKISRPVFNALPTAYWQNHTLAEQKKHAAFCAKAIAGERDHAVTTQINLDKDITEAWVFTIDRPQLFADLTGAMTASGASVVSAQLHTGTDGTVFNVFYLQNTEALAFGRRNPKRLADLEKLTLKAAKGRVKKFKHPPALKSKRADAIPIKPDVSILPQGSSNAIIEVRGRDRPGLLHELARTISAHGMSIHSAHIEVRGPMAIDTFYVSLTPGTLLKGVGLSNALYRVFSAGEDQAAPSKVSA